MLLCKTIDYIMKNCYNFYEKKQHLMEVSLWKKEKLIY